MRDDLAGPAPDCGDEMRDALPALLHARLAGVARARVEAHVAGCAACAAELTLIGDVRGALTAGAPRVDLDAVAAAVRTATVAAGPPRERAQRAVARPAPAWAAGGPRAVARPAWRGARAWRAVAATVLVAVGAGAVVIGRRPAATDGAAAGSQVAAAPSAASLPALAASPGASAAPAVLAAAEPSLGARFDDLTDEELQAVLDAVEEADDVLPSEEPESAPPALPGGGA